MPVGETEILDAIRLNWKKKKEKKQEFYFNLFLFRPFAILYCFGAYDALLLT